MKAGDLVEMYGEPGFYGVILKRTKSSCFGKCWTVLWQSGWVFDREENLMELIQ